MSFLLVFVIKFDFIAFRIQPQYSLKRKVPKSHTMRFNTACFLLFCSYMVTTQVSAENMEIEDKYLLMKPSKILQRLQEFYNIPRHRLLQLQHNLRNNYLDSYVRGKRPFFLQAIAKPNSVAPLKRMSPPLKRIVCNRGKDSNCKYLFTFLNRS